MNTTLKLTLVTSIFLFSNAYASAPEDRNPSVRKAIQKVTQQSPKELDIVNGFWHMFHDATFSGNIRSLYSGYYNNNDTDTYATAVGGDLQYELAKYKGFNAAIAFTTTHDLSLLSGEKGSQQHNEELSGTTGTYTELTQAYLDYRFKEFSIRIGRQTIDTPLADTDDTRMVPNTFQAYTLLFKQESFSLLAGYFTKWQGSGTGLEQQESWVKSGENGVGFGGLTFSNNLIETNIYYYHISNPSQDDILKGVEQNGNNAFYFDAIIGYYLSKNVDLHTGVQYLKENEVDKSGISANIYGAMAELIVNGIGVNIAYNKALKQTAKKSFSGYGGGTLFTNMDAMILDEITEDRDAQAIVAGLAYKVDNFNFLFAFGDFQGNANSSGVKEHITEQNIGAEYSPNDTLTLGAIYVIDKNKEDVTSTNFNGKNLRFLLSYNF